MNHSLYLLELGGGAKAVTEKGQATGLNLRGEVGGRTAVVAVEKGGRVGDLSLFPIIIP